jgi:hypothetical protein
MNGACLFPRARVFPLVFLIASIAPVAAQGPPAGPAGQQPSGAAAAQCNPEIDKAVAELVRASVDQLKKDAALSAQRSNAAPAEAWWAVGSVGALFVIAWTIVSWRRERARENEAFLGASIKGVAVDDKARIDEVERRIRQLIDLVKEAEKKTGGSSTIDTVLARLREVARSLTRPTQSGGTTS